MKPPKAPKGPTFKEYIEKHYLPRREKLLNCGQLARTSYVAYEVFLRIHLLPAFGDYKIDQITRKVIDKYYIDKLPKHLKPGTQKSILRCLHAVLASAYRD